MPRPKFKRPGGPMRRAAAQASDHAAQDAVLLEVVAEAGGVAGVLDEAHVIGNQWSRHRGVALLRALAKWAADRGES